MKRLTGILVVALAVTLVALPAFAGFSGPPPNAPEPTTLLLVAAGVGTVALVRRARSKN